MLGESLFEVVQSRFQSRIAALLGWQDDAVEFLQHDEGLGVVEEAGRKHRVEKSSRERLLLAGLPIDEIEKPGTAFRPLFEVFEGLRYRSEFAPHRVEHGRWQIETGKFLLQDAQLGLGGDAGMQQRPDAVRRDALKGGADEHADEDGLLEASLGEPQRGLDAFQRLATLACGDGKSAAQQQGLAEAQRVIVVRHLQLEERHAILTLADPRRELRGTTLRRGIGERLQNRMRGIECGEHFGRCGVRLADAVLGEVLDPRLQIRRSAELDGVQASGGFRGEFIQRLQDRRGLVFRIREPGEGFERAEIFRFRRQRRDERHEIEALAFLGDLFLRGGQGACAGPVLDGDEKAVKRHQGREKPGERAESKKTFHGRRRSGC